MGRTTYKLTEFDELRHGHDMLANPGKDQWHRAGAVHRADPDAHTRNNSWDADDIIWSRDGQYRGQSEREVLISQARADHDAALGGHRVVNTWRDAAPQREVANATIQHLADEGSGDEDVDAIIEVLKPHLDRIAQVEQVTASLTKDVTNVATISEQVADALELREFVSEANNELRAARDELRQAAEQRREVVFVVSSPNARIELPPGQHHYAFPKLLALASALQPNDRNIWIAGPAGSGKTSMGHSLAKAFGDIPYENQGAISNPFELMGFVNVSGYQDTAFRRRYEQGGVLMLDEIDASSPDALLALNAAVSNSAAAFPDGMVKRHPDFYLIASANTWGFGGDVNYVGRSKLDAASLDRFVTLSIGYDEDFERVLAGGSPRPRKHQVVSPYLHDEPTVAQAKGAVLVDHWIDTVQGVRASTFSHGAPGMVISPRASIKGAQLLRAGLRPDVVVEAIFGRYQTHSQWSQVGKLAEDFAKLVEAPSPQREPEFELSDAPRPSPANSALRNVNFSNVRVFGQSR